MHDPIDDVLFGTRYDGYECDNHLGPFLTCLRRWHEATEARKRTERAAPSTASDDRQMLDDDDAPIDAARFFGPMMRLNGPMMRLNRWLP